MKTPLVLLHGYPFNHTMWNEVMARVNSEVIAPDLRGFGQTPVGDDEPSIDSMADDILHLLDERRIERGIVAGFSMGGYVALSFAERYAHRLAGFGLINSQALPDTPEARAGRRAMIDKVRREGPQAAADAAVPKLFAKGHDGKKELVRFAIA